MTRKRFRKLVRAELVRIGADKRVKTCFRGYYRWGRGCDKDHKERVLAFLRGVPGIVGNIEPASTALWGVK